MNKTRTPKEMAEWLIKNRENPLEICDRDIKLHRQHLQYESLYEHNKKQMEWWEEVKKEINKL